MSHPTALKKIRLKTSNIKSNIDSSQQILVKKIDSITYNQPNYIKRLYKEVANTNPDNASVIYDYIIAEQTEINIKESTTGDKIKKLCWLSKYLSHKSFHSMTKQEILDYLNNLKKPVSDDPKHKSIGTYNGRQMVFLKFFRWLYNPDEPDHRKRITPPCMIGVKVLPRKEKSPYNPEDVWRRINFGQPISRDGMLKHYQEHYRDDYFPKLLKNRSVPLEDKEAIKKLLLKPWNLYIFRHSALTHKSQILKESTLRDHAGWTMNSKMPTVYLHYFGTESSNSLLEAYGIVKNREKEINTLKPKLCPNCTEPNKPDSRFCVKCRMVLTYYAYSETLEKQQEKEDKLSSMEKQFNTIQSQMQALITALGTMESQSSKQAVARQLIEKGLYSRPSISS